MSRPIGSIAYLVSGLLLSACGSGGAFTADGSAGNATGGESSVAGANASAGGNSDGGKSSGTPGGAPEGGGAGDTSDVGGAPAGAGGAVIGLGGGSGIGGSGIGGSGVGGSGVGGSTGVGALCPVASGYYQTIKIEGGGCGDLASATATPVCISAGVEVCRYQLKSGDPKSVSGAILLQPNGAFDGAMISEGSATRSGCKGEFSGNTLTIACGGPDASGGQYCGAALTRTGATCP